MQNIFYDSHYVLYVVSIIHLLYDWLHKTRLALAVSFYGNFQTQREETVFKKTISFQTWI